MSRHPADRDLRTYRWASVLCAVGLIMAIFGLGYQIKRDHKAPTVTKMGGCYVSYNQTLMCP